MSDPSILDSAIAEAVAAGDDSQAAFLRGLRMPNGSVKPFLGGPYSRETIVHWQGRLRAALLWFDPRHALLLCPACGGFRSDLPGVEIRGGRGACSCRTFST